MAKKKDKYDRAIEYLTANPNAIYSAWMLPSERRASEIKAAHCLFQVARPDPERGGDEQCGCLTQIRLHDRLGVRGRSGRVRCVLTDRVKRDKRIPMHPMDIRVEHLPVFAEWQRRLDKELGRR